VAGARANRAGAGFEHDLDAAHNVYAEMGLARLRRLPVPTYPCGPDGTRRVMAAQDYDYFGIIGPNAGPPDCLWLWHGQPIAMEAKSNSNEETSLPVAADTSGHGGRRGGGGLALKQLESLREAYRDYGVASIVVWRAGEKYRVLLPDALEEAARIVLAGERKSIPAAMFTPFDRVRYEHRGFVADWLFPLRLWLEANGRPSAGLSSKRMFTMIAYTLDVANRTVRVKIDGKDEQAQLGAVDRESLDRLAAECANPGEFLRRAATIQADFGSCPASRAAQAHEPG